MKTKISLISQEHQSPMTNNYTRMFRGRIRMSTCRIILITSLAWLLIDVIIIMKYTDGMNGGLFKRSNNNNHVEVSLLCVHFFLCVKFYTY